MSIGSCFTSGVEALITMDRSYGGQGIGPSVFANDVDHLLCLALHIPFSCPHFEALHRRAACASCRLEQCLFLRNLGRHSGVWTRTLLQQEDVKEETKHCWSEMRHHHFRLSSGCRFSAKIHPGPYPAPAAPFCNTSPLLSPPYTSPPA